MSPGHSITFLYGPAVALLASSLVWAQPPSPVSGGNHGEKLFAQGCAVGYCHGAAGAAARSPRLRGRAFERDYLTKVIRDGIPGTAMPAWRDRLTDPDIEALVDYIASLANAPAESNGGAPVEPGTAPVIEKTPEVPVEYRKGHDLFFDLDRQSRCSVCHRLAGTGVAVGPDPTKVASIDLADGPQVLRFGRPGTVRTIVLADGERFAGVVAERTNAISRIFDVSGTPPVLRSFANSEIRSIQRQSRWRHNGAVREYTNEELQAIWDYVRWLANKK